MITLSAREWTEIRKRLLVDYNWKPSVLLIRTTMREQLGFTPRYHSAWDEQKRKIKETVFLDFFNDEKETLFRLKYL